MGEEPRVTGVINGRVHLLPQAEKRQDGMSEVRKAVDVLSPEGAYAAVKLLKRTRRRGEHTDYPRP